MKTSPSTPVPLTNAQRQKFRDYGFLASVPILSQDEVWELRDRVDHIRHNLAKYKSKLYEVESAHSERPDEVICHFLGAWLIDSKLRELVFDPRLTVPAAQLLEVDRLRFWHDQVFYKPAMHPGVVPWHQDYSYWTRVAPARHITINLLLDDADEKNGCLQFVPGSHRWGLLPSLPFDSPLEQILEYLSVEHAADFLPQFACVPAGSATFHHSHTLHGSAGNRSTRPRRALVFNYMCAQTRVADDTQPLLRLAPHLPVGALVEGELFPIVLPRLD
ncbi:MAG: phytanoyl-CoA dioxygenase family protein [Planctomycetes bacterium]|nr:phytanoyl-CoA dioxygenase family protein [Planctomycetota bacterium]